MVGDSGVILALGAGEGEGAVIRSEVETNFSHLLVSEREFVKRSVPFSWVQRQTSAYKRVGKASRAARKTTEKESLIICPNCSILRYSRAVYLPEVRAKNSCAVAVGTPAQNNFSAVGPRWL